VHCIYCGTQLPDVAAYCSNCGKAVAPSAQSDESASSGVDISGQRGENARSVVRATAERPHASYKWALAYGWFFILAAVYLLLSGILTLLAGFGATPLPSPGAARPIGTASAIGQGALFLATGLSIIRRRTVAIRLVWASTILGGLGVVLRGFIPLDLIAWLVTVALARWFSKKRPLLVG
jgi:zinc-ribbon domain